MAEKRMFSKSIIDSDSFLEMPATSQLLYFHLSMRADDDGFINKPKSIMRMVGCKDDDIKVLFAKKYVIPFESGIVVIKHWRINNYIRQDTYHKTNYTDEMAMLELDENNAYRLSVTESLRISDENTTQISIDKNRLDKNRLDKGVSRFTPPTYEEVKEYCDERNNGIDPQRFIDFYESKGWLVGKTKMKDWKACVRTWEARSDSNKAEEDVLPTYDTSKNKKISDEEIEELLSLRGK